MQDPYGAFITHDTVQLPGTPGGPLSGCTFAAKDLFDVAGHVTGNGNPDWLRTHGPATHTADVVQALLDAGADLVGKTHTDELFYSLNGENAHYGTPVNPNAPGRIPGGSSSGSASAVAGQLVDFALGSDTGGSVRVPASYCGIYGIRPTHGRLSLAGATPMAMRFDTVGWFARDPALLRQVGQVLYGRGWMEPKPAPALLYADDAFKELDAPTRTLFLDKLKAMAEKLGLPIRPGKVSENGLDEWRKAFRLLQAREVWQNHGAWVRAVNPTFGPGIRERFAFAETMEGADLSGEEMIQEQVMQRMNGILDDGGLLCIPSAAGPAPRTNLPDADLEAVRNRTMNLTCIAGMAGLPQVSMPLLQVDGLPFGVSLVTKRHGDERLLNAAVALAEG